MDMPKPGDVHKQLERLIGEWSGEETLYPSPWDPKGGKATGSVRNRWIVDGFAVVQEYEQRRGKDVTFRGHGVFWFDPASREYVMHWWDSMGAAGSAYRGQLENDRLMLGAPTPQGGHARTSWTTTGPNSHTFLMEVSPDGQMWQAAMEGRYRRRAATKAAKAGAAKKAARSRPAKRSAAAASTKRQKTAKKAGRKPAGSMAARRRKSR
jgi:hypothetical protein